ncbi:hypothetical protein P6709_20255, partial [Jeotgalibacillus sp. ET6]|uniref:hypothetical protein n=1 Tax=Jeotgalibacillus sp. ET6 TaxID=3037260 RepID=UPI00241823DE
IRLAMKIPSGFIGPNNSVFRPLSAISAPFVTIDASSRGKGIGKAVPGMENRVIDKLSFQ